MGSRYFSIDDIIAEEERIPVTWRTEAKRMGHLDPSSGTEDVARGDRMELPLWLAENLAGHGLVTVALPLAYSRRSRDEIKADAVSTSLRERSPHFYTVGLRLAALMPGEEAQALPKDVHDALADRVSGILHRGTHSLGTDTSAFRGQLADLERSLFDGALRFAGEKMAWRRRTLKSSRGGGASAAGAAAGVVEGGLPVSKSLKRSRSLLTSGGT